MSRWRMEALQTFQYYRITAAIGGLCREAQLALLLLLPCTDELEPLVVHGMVSIS